MVLVQKNIYEKKILVTGGAGFVGANLIEELVKNENNDVTSLDCYFTGGKENHINGVNYYEGFTWDVGEIFERDKFDLIYHFGEYSRIVHSFNDINFVSESILRGTPKVFEFAKKNVMQKLFIQLHLQNLAIMVEMKIYRLMLG